MVRLHHCVSVACDQCGDQFDGHFPSEDAALDAAAGRGWYVRDDGRVWCPACGRVLTCEVDGHEFTEWHRSVSVSGGHVGTRCACDPHGPVHPLGSDRCVRRFRYCRRCHLHESGTGQAVA